MKNKILSLGVSMLFIITVIPASGFTINIYEKDMIYRHDSFEDYPGCMTTPYPEFNTQDIPQIETKHHKITLPIYDKNITDMIQQLNESMVLRYLENLTDFGPRVTGTSECYAAGDYIYNEFEDMDLEVRFHNWSYEGYTDRNVEATIYGTNSPNDEIYIICAHFDSAPDSPGTDDDGSGIATVLAVANIFQQYVCDHTVRFVTFSGEEQGLFGSHVYAEEAYDNGDNIVAVLNVDMIGYAETAEGGNKVTIRQNEASVWLTNFTSNVSQLYHEYINLEIISEFDPYGYSDHYSFWQFGYDAIQYREFETNPYYHTPEDTIEHMNISYTIKVSKLTLATLAELLEFNGLPDLLCEGDLAFGNVSAGATLTDSFTIENVGGGLLDWKITDEPSWGTWTFEPDSGYDLEPGTPATVEVTVVAPKQKDDYNSTITITNMENPDDTCLIDVSMTTPMSQPSLFLQFLERFIQRFPVLELIFSHLLG